MTVQYSRSDSTSQATNGRTTTAPSEAKPLTFIAQRIRTGGVQDRTQSTTRHENRGLYVYKVLNDARLTDRSANQIDIDTPYHLVAVAARRPRTAIARRGISNLLLPPLQLRSESLFSGQHLPPSREESSHSRSGSGYSGPFDPNDPHTHGEVGEIGSIHLLLKLYNFVENFSIQTKR